MALEILTGLRNDFQIDGIVTIKPDPTRSSLPKWRKNWFRKNVYGYTPKYLCKLPIPLLGSWDEELSEVIDELAVKFINRQVQCFIEETMRKGLKRVLIPYLWNDGGIRTGKTPFFSILLRSLIAYQFYSDLTLYLYIPDKVSIASSDNLMEKVQSFLKRDFVEPTPSPLIKRASQQRSNHVAEESVSKSTVPHQSEGKRDLVASSSKNSSREIFCSVSFSVVSRRERDLNDYMKLLDLGFAEFLILLIENSGRKPSEVYHRALIDRKLFSKIRCNKNYKPTKPTAVAFALALELDLKTTRDLLRCAGFALSHSSKFDLIVEYFISNKIYNIIELNETLYRFDQPLLGAEI